MTHAFAQRCHSRFHHRCSRWSCRAMCRLTGANFRECAALYNRAPSDPSLAMGTEVIFTISRSKHLRGWNQGSHAGQREAFR
jgi:hypothetical protein